MKTRLKDLFLENLVAKLMALLIAVFLWTTILGRRDFVLTKVFDLQLVTSPGQAIVAQTADRVRVRVSGPRSSLRRFIDDPKIQNLALDISNLGSGLLEVDIPTYLIQTPNGVKVLSVRPNMIRVEVTPRK
jgi:YbbR domain-containing protein